MRTGLQRFYLFWMIFSIIAAMVSNIFLLKNLLYSPTWKKVKIWYFQWHYQKNFPEVHNYLLSSGASHTTNLRGQEQHPNSFDNHFCTLTSKLHSQLWHVQFAQECKVCWFLRGCLSQILANHSELAKYGGKGAGTDVTSHLSVFFMLSDYGQVCLQFWVRSKRY